MASSALAERELSTTSSTAKKPGRFETLDGMRGLAAFAVVLLHLTGEQLPGVWHPREAFLAVDFFFGLSGFVLAYNYDERFRQGLSARTFMWLRARRLFPLYYIGLIGGVLTLFLGLYPLTARVWISIALHLLMLPGVMPGLGHPLRLFVLNIPAWSLFFEFWVANLVYAVFWRRLQGRGLGRFLYLSLAVLLVCLYKWGNLMIGWSYATLAGGVPRTLFPFFAGVMIARYYKEHPPKRTVPAPVILLLLLACLCLPVMDALSGTYQMVCVSLFFPALIYFGAAADRGHSRFMEWLGDASYAAYAIHWPMIYVLTFYALKHHWPRNLGLQVVYASLLMIVAYGVHRYMDVPIRRWIAMRWPIRLSRPMELAVQAAAGDD